MATRVKQGATTTPVEVTSVAFSGETWPLRKPCSTCGKTGGTITTVNGQDIVRCICGQYSHAAPRSETGREQRSLRTRPDIKPGQRARIFLRDGDACVLCHASDTQLDVGHLIDVDSGRAEGMTDAELWDDNNLSVMCATCNSGIRNEPLPLKLAMRIFWVRHHRAERP